MSGESGEREAREKGLSIMLCCCEVADPPAGVFSLDERTPLRNRHRAGSRGRVVPKLDLRHAESAGCPDIVVIVLVLYHWVLLEFVESVRETDETLQ